MYMLYLCQFGVNIGTWLGASVRVGMDVCSCGWVFVFVDNIDSCNISLSCIGSLIGCPHRLVCSFPMCPVKQYHLPIKLHHSYNQYVGLGSVCVCVACVHQCGRWGWVCVYICVCLYICA